MKKRQNDIYFCKEEVDETPEKVRFRKYQRRQHILRVETVIFPLVSIMRSGETLINQHVQGSAKTVVALWEEGPLWEKT
jgi:hypothetical protein